MSDEFDIAPPPEPSSSKEGAVKKSFFGKLFSSKRKSRDQTVIDSLDDSYVKTNKPTANDVDEIRSRLGLDKPARSVDKLKEELEVQQETTSQEEAERYDQEQSELDSPSELGSSNEIPVNSTQDSVAPDVPVSDLPVKETELPVEPTPSDVISTSDKSMLEEQSPDIPVPEPITDNHAQDETVFDDKADVNESETFADDTTEEQAPETSFASESKENVVDTFPDNDEVSEELEGLHSIIGTEDESINESDSSNSSAATDVASNELSELRNLPLGDDAEYDEPSKNEYEEKPSFVKKPTPVPNKKKTNAKQKLISSSEKKTKQKLLSGSEKNTKQKLLPISKKGSKKKPKVAHKEDPVILEDKSLDEINAKLKEVEKKSKAVEKKEKRVETKELEVNAITERIKKKQKAIDDLEKKLAEEEKELEKNKKLVERKEKKFAGLKDKEQLFVKQVATVEKQTEENTKLFEKLKNQSLKLEGKEKKISSEESELKKTESLINSREKEVNKQLAFIESQQDDYKKRLLKFDKQIKEYVVDSKNLTKEKINFTKYSLEQENLIRKAKDELSKTRDSLFDRMSGFQGALHEREEELDLREHSFAEWSPRVELESKKQKDLRLKQTDVLKRLAENDSLIKKLSAPPQLLDDHDEMSMISNDYSSDLAGLLHHARDLIKQDNLTEAKLKYNELREKFLTTDVSSFKKRAYSQKLKELYSEINVRLLEGRAREKLR